MQNVTENKFAFIILQVWLRNRLSPLAVYFGVLVLVGAE